MTSKDLVIRTERNVIDVVIGLEGEAKDLRREFEDFRSEVLGEFKIVRQEMKEMRTELRHQNELLGAELRGVVRSVDTMTNIFSWGFALVAIAVASAPMLREFFVHRLNKRNDAELEEKIREVVNSMRQ